MKPPFLPFLIVALPLSVPTICFSQTSTEPGGDVEQRLREMEGKLEAQDQVIRNQQQQIEGLQSEKHDTWLNDRRAEEVRQLVREVLADAETRASMAEGGITAGHNGKNFFLASEDGSFLMNFSGIIQVRYVFNNREDASSPEPGDDGEAGFQIRRAKLVFDGHVSSPRITYKIQIAGNRDSGNVELENAIVGYSFAEGWKVEGGRWKDKFLREEYTSASRQLAAERSLVNAVFTTHYVEGVNVSGNLHENVKGYFSINDGLRSGDPGGVGNDFQNDASDFAVTARGDVKLAGDWKQIDDFSAWSGEALALFVGGGVHYEVAETGDSQGSSPGVDRFISYTVDGSLEFNGFNLYAAGMGSHVELVDSAATDDLSHYGVVVQGGYMVIPDKLEPFARYEFIHPDDALDLGNMSLVTMGANYYLRKHSTRFTFDVVWALDPLNPFAFAGNRSSLGLLPDSPNRDDQVALRAQFQLLF